MRGRPVDVDVETRRALEFDELLEWIAGFAATGSGGRRVLALQPSADADAVVEQLATVDEAGRYLEDRERLVPGSLPDAADTLAVLGIDGAAIEPPMLRDLAVLLDAAADLRRRVGTAGAEGFPRLSKLGSAIPDLRREARAILECVEPDGSIADGASSELRRLRRARARGAERLQATLESMLHAPDSAAVIRDEFITQRNGRFVIPIRTDSPRPVRGIVHATSSSGATQFVEPLETVEQNNELVRLSELEREEEVRLVREWTDGLRSRAADVGSALDAMAALDALQARALFARACRAVVPRVDRSGPLVVRSLRHPLLERRLAEEGRDCVPLSFDLDPSDRVLVLSGPNTGGKTVALKTIGLAVLMALAGIPVTAEKFRLPVYRQVRADVGDHQSIQADLSTFSAHVKAVVACLDSAAPPAMFLFDEIGTGTEPEEGAALAQSILEAMLQPGVTTVATTHLATVKAWALTTDGAASAAMEFDSESLEPTYRILMDAAGVSAGLEIASRLGLDEKIIERARGRIGEDTVRAEKYLDRLRNLTREVGRRREELVRDEQALVEERRRVASRAEQERRERRRKAGDAIDATLRGLRETTKRELDGIRDRQERRRAEREVARLHGKLRMEAARAKEEIAPSTGGGSADGWTVPDRLTVGMDVFVRSLGRRGTVREVRGEKVEVQLGRMNFGVDRSEIRVGPGGQEPVPKRMRGPAAREAARAAGLPPRRELPRELMLLGMTVDEALSEVDKFLDAAAVAGHAEVRVVHGHGTGRLKSAVREFLESHPHVLSHRPGKPREGGDGATVATLR